MELDEYLALMEERILGQAHLSLEELVERSGMELEAAEELWLGLGFPVTRAEGLWFTDADLEVLSDLTELRNQGYTGLDIIVPMTRVLGQALARVATAQVEVFRPVILDALAESERGVDPAEVLEPVAERMVSGFERFVTYVWRRQLVAAMRRELLGEDSGAEVVGFVDLVDFTEETRDLDDAELTEVLDRFHRTIYEHVTSVEGRLIKVVGDGAMFTTRTPHQAATAALGMVAATALDDRLKGVRVGLARGHTVPLDGDLYGATVNRASRLADHAFPHSVLVDDETGRALEADGYFQVKRTKPQKLKGLGTEPTWVVRRPHVEVD